MALAIEILCFSPPDNLTPFSPIIVFSFDIILLSTNTNVNKVFSQAKQFKVKNIIAEPIKFFQKSIDEVIRTQEHLRRIRGF